MQLYLLRHAHALDAENDDARPLSPEGHRQVQTLAKFLATSGVFSPAQVWHSPLVRARETATQLTHALALRSRLVETPGLRPEDDPRMIASRLIGAPGALALVGHEPHLSAFASWLLTGECSPAVVAFDKCTLLALEGAGQHWVVRWQIAPELLAGK